MFNFPQIEEKILQKWAEKDIFKKSLSKDSPKGEYSFYDGPPFATGLPHYGHLVASLMKDMVPRFWTMRGYRVERRWGWDCHGLPIENIVEKELGLKQKKDIIALGVDKFNEACRSKVMVYAAEWRKIIERFGRWVDMDNDYKTMDKTFMESVWWVFKQLWDKGLIYQSYKSMHICPRCETTLSQSEVAEGYQDTEDVSVIVKFELVDEPGTFVLAWTTTPWTLPGNAALAVGEDVDYVKIKVRDVGEEYKYKFKKGESYIFSKQFVENHICPINKNEDILDTFGSSNLDFLNFNYKVISSSDLVGKKYKPLFNYFDNEKLGDPEIVFKIYAADFVTTTDGTGVVHIAPAFGEDDMNLGKKENLPFIQHVGIDGRFSPEVLDWPGLEVKPKENPQATDLLVVKYLKEKNLLFSQENYTHSYPHCWRCDTPLLNYNTSSYFVAVEKIKDQLLTKAKSINWFPDHIKEGRFGDWLEGARDWSISRQRFWASVIPLWICESCGQKQAIGSVEELEKLSGAAVQDLHKHFIDPITFTCSKCQGLMRRIPDVLDCWFEAGSMPYAELHYPFANKEKFEQSFPARFIAEGADQTRAWFYYLHVLAVALQDQAAYQNVIVNGIVLAEDGKKMAKKLKNYPDPSDMFVKYGADAVRYYLAASPVMKADNLCFCEKEVDLVVKKILLILGNVLSFYQMYADKNVEPQSDSVQVLDRWILAKLFILNREVTASYESYYLNGATRPLADFINDLSTWYLRRSRDRFKGDDKKDKQAALTTLKYVLHQLSLLMAPVMPFTADWLYQELGGELESVHLEVWPDVKSVPEWLQGSSLLVDMDVVKKIVELALAKRDEVGIKIRQPLAKLMVSGAKLSSDYLDLIKDEVNVKEVVMTEGKELAVELDMVLSPELKQEGLSREFVRQINALRKEQKLSINDVVVIEYQTDSELVIEMLKKFSEEIKKSTISKEIKVGAGDKELVIDGEGVKVLLVK
ncbi:MAG: isoleucine--tRNA ligase [Candidatus Komeilibacteria bacterium]|nr:isoleucine--tRNA ligase [Candidatus Komeilibacteria bacterium]